MRELSVVMQNFNKKTREHSGFPVYILAAMAECSHVFLRLNDTEKQALTPLYKGPYLVVERDKKTFVVDTDSELK